MPDISMDVLTLFAVVVAKPQQIGPSWMTIAVSVVCLIAVVIALRGDGRAADARCGSRGGQRYLD